MFTNYHKMDNLHDITGLILWYQHFANASAEPIRENFQELQEYADELNLLRDCFQNPGSVSLIHPSTMDPGNLPTLHQAITASSLSLYSTRFLVHHSVRKFYINFSLQDVNQITKRKMAKVTLIELLVVLNRMLESQGRNLDYPDIFEDDLPYRSRSWVLNLIQYLESEYIGRMCLSEDFGRLNNIVGRFIAIIDFYEVTLERNEISFLNDLAM